MAAPCFTTTSTAGIQQRRSDDPAAVVFGAAPTLTARIVSDHYMMTPKQWRKSRLMHMADKLDDAGCNRETDAHIERLMAMIEGLHDAVEGLRAEIRAIRADAGL